MALNTNLKTFSNCSIASTGSWKGCFGLKKKKRRENAKRKTFGLRWCRTNPLEKQWIACRAARRSLAPTKHLLASWVNLLDCNTGFGSNNWRLKWCFTGFIVQRNKRLLLFLVRQKMPAENGRFFAYVISRKRRANQRKKIHGNVFLFNWKPHAKIQALLREKKKHTQNRHLAPFCTHPFNCS